MTQRSISHLGHIGGRYRSHAEKRRLNLSMRRNGNQKNGDRHNDFTHSRPLHFVESLNSNSWITRMQTAGAPLALQLCVVRKTGEDQLVWGRDYYLSREILAYFSLKANQNFQLLLHIFAALLHGGNPQSHALAALILMAPVLRLEHRGRSQAAPLHTFRPTTTF